MVIPRAFYTSCQCYTTLCNQPNNIFGEEFKLHRSWLWNVLSEVKIFFHRTLIPSIINTRLIISFVICIFIVDKMLFEMKRAYLIGINKEKCRIVLCNTNIIADAHTFNRPNASFVRYEKHFNWVFTGDGGGCGWNKCKRFYGCAYGGVWWSMRSVGHCLQEVGHLLMFLLGIWLQLSWRYFHV